MQTFTNIWTWFNGKKIILAVIVGLISTTLTNFQNDSGVHIQFLDSVIEIANKASYYLGLLGIGHKIVKVNDTTPPA